MGAAGSPYAAFQRALKARNVTLALAEARDMPKLNLADSLELLLLIAEKQPDLYERAAVRFAGRLLLERRLSLLHAQVLVTTLAAVMEGSCTRSAAGVLRELVSGSARPRR